MRRFEKLWSSSVRKAREVRCTAQASVGHGFSRPLYSTKIGVASWFSNSSRNSSEIAKMDIITKIRVKTYDTRSELPRPRSGGEMGQIGPHVRILHKPTAQANCSFRPKWTTYILYYTRNIKTELLSRYDTDDRRSGAPSRHRLILID